MESIPDSGVDMRNAVVAPLLAPCFLSATAAGRTPHEQRGIGIPKSEALRTDRKRPFEKWRATEEGLRNICSRPLTKSPKRIYTDDSRRRDHAWANTLSRK